MAVTPREVFELTVALMDELSWPAGEADVAENRDFKARVLPLLTLLQGECVPFCEGYALADGGRRPACPPVTDFEAPIPGLDDTMCRTVLPYGLAAHLLLEENPSAAAFFQQKYSENRALMRALLPVTPGGVEDVYGGVEHSSFGRW